MARPIEDKPWHPDALKLRAAGVSFAQIADQLGLPKSTVANFCKRIADNPDRQVETLLNEPQKPKLAPMTVPVRQRRTLIDMVMLIERRRARTLVHAFDDLDAFHALTELDTTRPEFFKLATMKAQMAIESLKALKGSAGTVIDMDLVRQGKGAAGPEEETLQFEIIDPEPRQVVEGS